MSKLLLVTLVVLSFVAASYQEAVKLTLYYESLCPYCSRFTSNQLWRTYEKLGKENMILDFVPYGHATHTWVNGQWEFTCQHGPWECYGNKVQACALNQGYGQDIEFSFVHCVEAQSDPSSIATQEYCSKKLGLSWDTLYECSVTPAGAEYLVKYGERTKAFNPSRKPKFVPTIVFNDHYDQQLQDGATSDLLTTICSLYKVKPTGCM